ncbi:GNAT family N-acetyltransferase [Microbacterium sediminis]|uniref:Uncharacterized protein n=1 Tax=Microbacterium sediminis TaxID=904291 RepID=A0A1B9NDU8_9MICO|nr:GNAT family N-acetyltransferase [Microbacterium sediminis]OCG74779.1 hypothetical protein A7J15_04470 [Microbacterium sediminis]QBR75081.1 N-acetyltransferase [Microbacterium sediminis]
MDPFVIRTGRLLLDQPEESDIDAIAEYCADPLFERYMVTPWPYSRDDAERFVREFVPAGWRADDEWTWAVRPGHGAPLMGMIGVRFALPDVGYWLGAPHRGRGVMSEALSAVVDAVLERGSADRIHWETRIGNHASARTAEKAGFAFTGSGPGHVPGRDGRRVDSWHGIYSRGMTHEPKPGWPPAP